MATPRSQRIGIWIIAIIMVVGTLGSFLLMAMGTQNNSIDQVALQEAYTKYQADTEKQVKELSNKYYSDFNKYTLIPSPFKSEDIKEVSKKDLKNGDGLEIKKDTKYSAYYIGWNPKGVVFDQSISDKSLKAPIAGEGLIPGWTEGVIGMKFGGVREITIPSDKAYGSNGRGEDIPPNTPIKFVVMVIQKSPEIPIPDILMQYYQSKGM